MVKEYILRLHYAKRTQSRLKNKIYGNRNKRVYDVFRNLISQKNHLQSSQPFSIIILMLISGGFTSSLTQKNLFPKARLSKYL